MLYVRTAYMRRLLCTFLTVDLQHGRGLRLAHAVLRRAGVRPFILLFHAEQTEAVAVADLKPEIKKKNNKKRDSKRLDAEARQNE